MTTHFGPPPKFTWSVPQTPLYDFNNIKISNTVSNFTISNHGTGTAFDVDWQMIEDLEMKNRRRSLKIIEHDLMDEMTCPCTTCQDWRHIRRRAA